MTWWSAWSIRTKVIAICVSLALTTSVAGTLGIWAFSRMNSAFQVVATQSLPAVNEILQADRAMHQALVAERSLMFMSIATPDAKRQINAHSAYLAQVHERWRNYSSVSATETERTLRLAFEAAFHEWEQASREAVKILSEDTPASRRDAIDLSMNEGTVKFESARKILNELTSARIAQAENHARLEERQGTRMSRWVIAAVIASIGLAVGFAAVLARSIGGRLRQTAELLHDIADGDGDLTRRLDESSHDELGDLAKSFNRFVDKLHGIVRQTKGSADRVAVAAQQLSTGAERISSATQEQASSLEETAASMEELTGTVKQNADNARQASELAQGSRDTAERGGKVVTSAVSSMNEITQSSERIAEIITVIDEIAFQTNLLALNAAVEAARAGEHGRGFAVVATEVRNLAQRSASAAKEIKGLIRDSVQKIKIGAGLVNESGKTFEEIVTSVKRVTEITSEIAAASHEQSQGIEHVNNAVVQMDRLVQSSAGQTEELSSTALSLTVHAKQLREIVWRFKLAESHAQAEVPEPVLATASQPAHRARRDWAAHRPVAEVAPLAGVNGSRAADGDFEEF